MASGQITLRGRFSKGSVVRLVKVAHEGVLRAEGGEEIDTKTVEDEDGVSTVRFSTGVEVGARYIITGLNDGRPLEIRARGREKDDPAEVMEQPPIGPTRVRMADGSWSDERPTKESAPEIATTFPGQHQVSDGTAQRSDTWRGTAHPVDVEDEEPVRRQESVPDGTPQMSDTKPRELDDGTKVGGGGEAAELILGPQRQEDVRSGTLQRSDTEIGTAQPIPAGDMVHAQGVRDSSLTREARGDNTRGAAEPLEVKGARMGPPTGASKAKSEERQEEILKGQREAAAAGPASDQPVDAEGDTSGHDAMGQPAASDIATAAGVEPASKSTVEEERQSARARKAAATRRKNQKG